MRDQFGRTIDYMRLSITDRCNLRCRYCMPNGVQPLPHGDILSYEELLQVAATAVTLGITRFKVTGGEPLVRRGCVDFVRRLKALPGVEQVTLTTNGLLLAPLAVGLFAPFSSMVVLGQKLLARNMGFASGVTLGLPMTLGGMAMSLLGWIADNFGGLGTAMACLVPVAALGALASLRLRDDAAGERA